MAGSGSFWMLAVGLSGRFMFVVMARRTTSVGDMALPAPVYDNLLEFEKSATNSLYLSSNLPLFQRRRGKLSTHGLAQQVTSGQIWRYHELSFTFDYQLLG
ncbi:hypothetical protein Q1695_001275 [Nippostrongylus brasiliensis]|nr:hypothetical protein Q1695_001275 [Nippostrongylus brasiliensis]